MNSMIDSASSGTALDIKSINISKLIVKLRRHVNTVLKITAQNTAQNETN
jgi:hypothetical protein